MVKSPPAMRETWVRSVIREDPLEKSMATRSSIPAWRIPWTEEPGGLVGEGAVRMGGKRRFTLPKGPLVTSCSLPRGPASVYLQNFAGGGTRGSSAAGWTRALPPGRDGIFKPSAGNGPEQEVGERAGLQGGGVLEQNRDHNQAAAGNRLRSVAGTRELARSVRGASSPCFNVYFLQFSSVAQSCPTLHAP